MNENDAITCPKCGTEIPSLEAPGGLCPKCLLLGSATADGLPSLEELQSELDQYDVLELIGRGGMGAVYKARHKELDRTVAIKVLIVDDSEGAMFADRFRREAQVMAKLDHPNIVKVHDFGTTDAGHYYIAMDFIDGSDLHKQIRAQKIDAQQALQIVSDICDALQYAHDQGYVHRDIKPANILIDHQGKVKVGDFGLARILNGDLPDSEPTLTMTGAAMGTPNYIAPEQLSQSGKVDRRADIFSLGVMFYEMLTGEVPRGRFAPPSEKAAVDSRLDDVVMRAMDSEPERRYQQASEVRSDVDAISSGSVPPKSEKSSKTRPSKFLITLIVLGCIAFLAVVGILMSSVIWMNVRSESARYEDERARIERQDALNKKYATLRARERIDTARKYAADGHTNSARENLLAGIEGDPSNPDVVGEAILLLHQLDYSKEAITASHTYFLHAPADHALQQRVLDIVENNPVQSFQFVPE